MARIVGECGRDKNRGKFREIFLPLDFVASWSFPPLPATIQAQAVNEEDTPKQRHLFALRQARG
jgi:hypothetical protein